MESVAAASSPHVYRPRRPERTVLYRALALHFEHFVQVYEERFRHTHGYLRGCVEPAVHRYLDCGISDQGVARVRCSDCRHEFLLCGRECQVLLFLRRHLLLAVSTFGASERWECRGGVTQARASRESSDSQSPNDLLSVRTPVVRHQLLCSLMDELEEARAWTAPSDTTVLSTRNSYDTSTLA